MDEATLMALRALLVADETDWQRQLGALLAEREPEACMAMRAFLLEKLESAGPRFERRMEAMVRTIEGHLAGCPLPLERLAAELEALQAQREEAERRMLLLKELLGLCLGPGTRQAAGEYQLRIGAPGFSLRVRDKGAIPAEFLAPQPDRKAILAHFKGTGEIPPGTEIKPTRPAVSVRRRGSGPQSRNT